MRLSTLGHVAGPLPFPESQIAAWVLPKLSPAERNVLLYVLAAASNKQIAGVLRICVQTVQKHHQSLLQKLGARNDVDLVLRVVSGDRGVSRSAREDALQSRPIEIWNARPRNRLADACVGHSGF